MKLGKLKFPQGDKKNKKQPEQSSEFDLSELDSELPESEEMDPEMEASEELPDSEDSQAGNDELSKFDDEELMAEIQKRGLMKDLEKPSEPEEDEQYI